MVSWFICKMNRLRQGRKKITYLILFVVDKNLRDQKIY